VELEVESVLVSHGTRCIRARRYDDGSMPTTVRMYSRPGCHLCDEARQVILAERARTGFAYEEIDVSGDDALELEYGIRIPVVLVNGEEAFEIQIDPSAFATAVRPS